jgi:FtsH-binding integral membrane protein
MDQNPYSAPLAALGEPTRRTRETGNENYFKVARVHLALACLLGFVTIMVGIALTHAPAAPLLSLVPVFALMAGFVALHLLLWQGAKKRKDWARVISIIVAIVSLPGFPVGTLVGVYLLANCWSRWREPEVYADTAQLLEGWPTAPLR